jgi:hypothetical protein
MENASKLYKIKYSDFYNDNDNLIISDTVRERTGIMLSELQIFSIRGACTVPVAKVKYKKRRMRDRKA